MIITLIIAIVAIVIVIMICHFTLFHDGDDDYDSDYY